MNVKIKKVSNNETIVEVQTRSGIKDLTITKTEFGYSHADFSEWDISDKNYYDLESLVEDLGDQMMGKKSSLNVSYCD